MFKPLKIPSKFKVKFPAKFHLNIPANFKKINLKKISFRNRYWQAQDYHFSDYLHTFSYQLKVDVNKSFRKELYRKLIHLSSLWIPLLIYLAPEKLSLSVFSIIFFGNCILEYGNFKKWRWARNIFGRIFSKTLRSKESARGHFQFSGAVYVMAAAIICTMCFDKIIAVISMTVMLISDTCSALFGKAYGTRQIYPHKSLEGTTAFFVSALLINMLFHKLEPFSYDSVIACILATLVEVYEDKTKVDDNLAIPLAVGLTLTFLN